MAVKQQVVKKVQKEGYYVDCFSRIEYSGILPLNKYKVFFLEVSFIS